MRYQISSLDLLRQMLAELKDDLTLPWQTYPCLIWPRCKGTFGYGLLRAEGKSVSAHRESFCHSFGAILPEVNVLHHCDNPPCFRPIHLFRGTHRDNVLDCIAKGRYKFHYIGHGSDSPQSILTDEQVLEIRSLRKAGWEQYPLADKFGVDQSLISLIVRGKRWGHL